MGLVAVPELRFLRFAASAAEIWAHERAKSQARLGRTVGGTLLLPTSTVLLFGQYLRKLYSDVM